MQLVLAAVYKQKAVRKDALLGSVQPAAQHGCSASQAATIQQGPQHAISGPAATVVAQCAIAAAEEVTMQIFLFLASLACRQTINFVLTQDTNGQANPTPRQAQGLDPTVVAIGTVVIVLEECFQEAAPSVFNYMTVVATVAVLAAAAQST